LNLVSTDPLLQVVISNSGADKKLVRSSSLIN